MHVTLLQTIEDQTYRTFVSTDHRPLNDRMSAVNLGAAVARLVNVGIGFQLIILNVFSACRVKRFGKGKFKAVRLDAHFVDFKRNLAAPNQALKGKWFSAT